MASYRWQCFECGLQFEASAPMSKRDKKHPCPECESPSERLMPEGVNGFFNKEVTGPGPQNTGISGLDAHIDRVIGAHAKQGWEEHGKRAAEKTKLLAQPEAEGKALSRNPDGSYRVMESEEAAVQKRALTIHNMAMERRKADKDSPAQ